MNDPNMKTLAEATIDDLFAELCTRGKTAVLLIDGQRGDDSIVRKMCTDGSDFAAAGMCMWASKAFLENLKGVPDSEAP